MPRSLVVALPALLLAASACSDHADHADPTGRSTGVEPQPASVDVVRGAPGRAAAAGRARIETTVTFDGPDGLVELRSSGAFDGERTTMSTDLGSMLSNLPEEDVGPVPAGFEEPARTVYDGDTVYLRAPLLDPLTGTSGWLSTTAGAALVDRVGGIDPLRVLGVLRGAGRDVEDLGHEEVRGADTTRYRATIEEQPVEVWIDAAGRPRRLRMAVAGAGTGRGLGLDGPATAVVEVFDYGEPVEIRVPAPGEVTPLAEVVPG